MRETKRDVRYWYEHTDLNKTQRWPPNLQGRQRRALWWEQGETRHYNLIVSSPDVEVKGDVWFDPQFVVLCRLKYTVVCSIVVLQQLTVQKSETKGDDDLRLINNVAQTGSQRRRGIFRSGREPLIMEQDIHSYRTNPLLEMISAWQSLTVSPLRLNSSPLTQRFPDGKKRKQKTKQETHSMSKIPTMQRLSVLQWPISALWQYMPLSTKSQQTKHHEKLQRQRQWIVFCRYTIPQTSHTCRSFHWLYAKVKGYTSSKADNRPQALPPPHDDGGQNLASQKAVLDTCGQGIETLVTQHCYLIMQSAAAHW